MERENKLAPEYFSVSVYIKLGCCLEKNVLVYTHFLVF